MHSLLHVIKESVTDVSRSFLKHIPEETSADEILLIGLFSPVSFRRVKNRFPKATVSVCEEPLEPVVLQKTFDIILVNTNFDHIRFDHHLAFGGYLAIKFFSKRGDVSFFFDKRFSRWKDWNFFGQPFALYRHFGQGHIGDPMPVGYQDRQQSRQNLEACSKNGNLYKVVGETGRIGLRTAVGPFVSEDYFTDEEPVIEPYPIPRIVKWQPITVSQKNGWKCHWFTGNVYQKGVGVITPDNRDAYWEEWSSHAKRHRNKWLRDDHYEMVDVTIDAFARAYHASKKLDWLTRTGFVRVLKFHEQHQPHALRLFGARDKHTGCIVAGLALLQLDDIQQSFHMISFICDSVRQTSVGVGLIDYWYKRGIAEGVHFFNFGIVWRKGDPKAWKGYSKFKRQFHLYLICYPKPLFKFVWRRK